MSQQVTDNSNTISLLQKKLAELELRVSLYPPSLHHHLNLLVKELLNVRDTLNVLYKIEININHLHQLRGRWLQEEERHRKVGNHSVYI
jgi:hypothetical protein